MLSTVIVVVGLAWTACVAATELDMGGAWYALGLALVPTVLAGVLTTEQMTRRWARERGAQIEGEALDVLHRQVLLSRVGRTLGVLGAWAIGTMVTSYYNTHIEAFAEGWDTWSDFDDAGGVWAMSALGYVVASVIVQATKPRMSVGSTAAVLDRRRLSDLLDLGVARLLRLYAGVAVLAAVVWGFERLDAGRVRPSAWAFVVPAVALVAVGAAEWVARRRQRAVDDEELAVDELTRTATANAIAGAAIAMFGLQVQQTVESLWPDPWFAATGAVLVFTLFGFGAWWGSGTSFVFRTRRIDALRAAT